MHVMFLASLLQKHVSLIEVIEADHVAELHNRCKILPPEFEPGGLVACIHHTINSGV